MFYLVLAHESRELDAVYLIQSADTSEIPFMLKRSIDTLEIIHIPEPVWKAMLYTERLVYKAIRPI